MNFNELQQFFLHFNYNPFFINYQVKFSHYFLCIFTKISPVFSLSTSVIYFHFPIEIKKMLWYNSIIVSETIYKHIKVVILMLHAGVSTACLYPKPVEEALYDLALGGVTHTEIFINTYSELRPDFVGNMAELMRRFEMTCRSLHFYTCELETLILFSDYPRRTADYLEYCRHYFSAMQTLGATVFVLHESRIPTASVNRQIYFERYTKLAELGDRYGICVALENVARCTSGSLEFLMDMKKALKTRAKFVLDLKQAVRAGENPMQMLKMLGENIVHIHLSDHGEYDDCLPIGKGRFPLSDFLKQLETYHTDCSVILELYRSGFRDLSELIQNYHLLEKRIQSAETTT